MAVWKYFIGAGANVGAGAGAGTGAGLDGRGGWGKVAGAVGKDVREPRVARRCS